MRGRDDAASKMNASDVSRFSLARTGGRAEHEQAVERSNHLHHATWATHRALLLILPIRRSRVPPLPASVLTHIVQAHAHVPQDPSL